MSNVGVAFVGTGGNKMVRALRSFRRTEPTLPVHLVFDTSTNSWQRNVADVPVAAFEQPNVTVHPITNAGYVNGAFNAGIRILRDLGHTHACMFQDDTVFSPLPEHLHHVSRWFPLLDIDPGLATASGLSLACMEALVRHADTSCWHRAPAEWDAVDLESIELWRKLCPGLDGAPALYFGSPGSEDGIVATDWFVKYFCSERLVSMARLGPTAFILPIATWEACGGFSESNGIFYDMEYPIAAAMRGLGVVKALPSIPHIHLHNQSTAFGDPAIGIWGHDLRSFMELYGTDPGTLAGQHGY